MIKNINKTITQYEFHRLLAVGGGLLSTRLLSLIIAIIVARIAGKAVFGQFTVFLTIFLIVSELPRVIDTTFIRFAKSEEDKGNEAKWHSLGIFVKLLYILICFFIGIFFSPFLADAFFNKPEVESILRYGFFSGSLLSIFTSLSAWYQANSRFELVALCRPVFFFIILLALLLLISFDLRIKPGTLAGLYTLIAAGLSLLVLFKFFGQIKASNLTLFKSFPGFLKITWILLLSSLIELTASKLDIFVITKYVTFENIGIYGVAARLASIVGLVTGAINIVQLPKAASAVGNKLFISKYLKTSFLYLSIQTLFALALIMTLKPIVALTVGEDFLPSSDIAIILIFQVLFISYGGPFKDLIQCGPNPEMMVAVSCLKFVLATIFLLALIPRYGLAGAAYSVAISSFVITLITISLAFRQIYKNPCS